ncbi:MAG: glycosyltransferase family 4 protein [Faecousia sp.]
MKRVLFITNYPSPYRVHFYDELGKYMDVTVLFSDRIEEKTHRDAAWFVSGEGRFHKIQLTKRVAGWGKRNLCTDVIPWLKKDFDAIVVCGYSSPTAMLAMAYLHWKKIPFYMEVDGGLVRQDSKLKCLYKKLLVSCADFWISSGEHTTDYLVHYGAKRENTFLYPFTSLWEEDILPKVLSPEEKQCLRRELGMPEEKIAVYVGRFTRAKGMDALLKAAPALDRELGIWFIGGEPTQAHLDFCRAHELSNVHFVGFQKKEELANYYRAADLLVLPTQSDVWGLVINEAMACGLPVITTNRCVAGLELIKDGVNGYIVPVDDPKALSEKITAVFSADYRQMGAAALETIRPYTFENMAKAHVEIFDRECTCDC